MKGLVIQSANTVDVMQPWAMKRLIVCIQSADMASHMYYFMLLINYMACSEPVSVTSVLDLPPSSFVLLVEKKQ